jgi:hypothetical protein
VPIDEDEAAQEEIPGVVSSAILDSCLKGSLSAKADRLACGADQREFELCQYRSTKGTSATRRFNQS